MRVPLVVLLLILTPALPALAHDTSAPGIGLSLTDLVITFDAFTQASIFSFDLENNGTGPASSLFASVTTLHSMLPVNNIRVGGPIAEGATAHFDTPVPLRFVADGCIHVFTTAVGQNKISNRECAQTSGATQAPTPLPVEIPVDTILDPPLPTLP